MTATALGDQGRGRGGGDFWRRGAALSLPKPNGQGQSPARASDSANQVVWGLGSVLPYTQDSGIPLGTESRLQEGLSHTSLLFTPRPPPYPETIEGGGGG